MRGQKKRGGGKGGRKRGRIKCARVKKQQPKEAEDCRTKSEKKGIKNGAK